MDWNRYKQLCDTPNVFSRWMLEQTVELLGDDVARLLEATLSGAPLAKPEDHRGGPPSDMFVLTLSLEHVERVCAAVEAAVRSGRWTSGTAERGLGGFHEAWSEYRRALEIVRVP